MPIRKPNKHMIMENENVLAFLSKMLNIVSSCEGKVTDKTLEAVRFTVSKVIQDSDLLDAHHSFPSDITLASLITGSGYEDGIIIKVDDDSEFTCSVYNTIKSKFEEMPFHKLMGFDFQFSERFDSAVELLTSDKVKSGVPKVGSVVYNLSSGQKGVVTSDEQYSGYKVAYGNTVRNTRKSNLVLSTEPPVKFKYRSVDRNAVGVILNEVFSEDLPTHPLTLGCIRETTMAKVKKEKAV